MIRIKVVLPQPDGPMKVTNSPRPDLQVDVLQRMDRRIRRLERETQIADVDHDVAGTELPRSARPAPMPRASPFSGRHSRVRPWRASSTSQPSRQSSLVAFSISLWLMPPSQGMKTMAVGATRLI